MVLPTSKIQADFTEKPLASRRRTDNTEVLEVSVLRGYGGLIAPDQWDAIACVYDANNNMTSAVYRLGGVVVLTLVMTYDANNNLVTVAKS